MKAIPLTSRPVPASSELPSVNFTKIDSGQRFNQGVASAQYAHFGYNDEQDWYLPETFIRWLRKSLFSDSES